MKSENYDELMDKFYAGIANTEEINFLKREGLLDEQDIFYADVLHTERGQKMNWEFEDFMKQLPQAKVVAISGRNLRMKRMMVAAAVVALVLTAFIFWPQPQKNQMAKVPAITKPVDSLPNIIAKISPQDEINYSEPGPEKVKKLSQNRNNYTAATTRENAVKFRKHSPRENVKRTIKKENFMVMVNGKIITNEADAVAITKESLAMFSRNLATTVDELRPIGQIKIKL